ncbi:NAC domain-containing protein 2 [Euphorbia peplus]|nr:NAC domain-containing protein 2 [Euphorbia peplus]
MNKQKDEEFFNNLPVGYRFAPTDEELVGYYLMNKILNHHIPFCRIRDQNIYEHHPDVLAEKYKLNKKVDNFWYFFTSRTKRYDNGSRPDRTAGNGYWKATASVKEICINGQKAAERRTLDYCKGPHGTKTKKTDWKMHEYILFHDFADSSSPSSSKDDRKLWNKCVLCKLYNKKYNPEASTNNNEDAIVADDLNTNQAPKTNNEDAHVDVEANTSAAPDDSNTNQAANTDYEDPAAETTTGVLNTSMNQTTDIIINNNYDEQISNQAQLVHYPTDPHQWYPQLQAAPANNNYCYPGPGIADNNNNNYCYHGYGINQDVYYINGQSCIPFGYDGQKPDDHQYQMRSNFWQSVLDQTDCNMGSSSNQVMPHPMEQLSNPSLMNGGPLDVQSLSSLPYAPKRARFGP